MKKQFIIVKLKYIKDLIKRFEDNEDLTQETNTFFNGLNLVVIRQ